MTFLLHAPDLVLYPEQYYKMIGCRDLYVKNAHPPIADYDVPLCFHTTTAYDYAYNTPHMDKDGFHYWNTYGFMKLDGSFEEIDPLVRGWEQVNLHRPERPERTTAFIADYDMADDRFENDARFIYNISSDGHYFLYRCSREAGIPSGFVLRWDSLETLTAEDTDLLVLPCMTNAPANAVEHIRRLYHEGVSLIGIGNVDGLEDLFGVKQSHRKTEVTRLEAFGETEYITPYVAEFFYTADGAAVYASANGEEVILRNGRTALINVPLSQIGRYNYHEMKPIQGEDTVSALLHRVGRTLMREMSNPLAKADHAALTAFRDVNGEKMLLAINYTPYRAMNNEPGSVEVSIKLDMPGIISAESEYAIESLCHDGETLKEINLRLEPFDAAMIHLIEA